MAILAWAGVNARDARASSLRPSAPPSSIRGETNPRVNIIRAQGTERGIYSRHAQAILCGTEST
ncbi:hypothetical protein CBOM_07464 [Ceraceosorus bombacis]|uniref:Uncharacterized protein n=1 Tax=Ceraceosorus bombacis TaxID=401625 RepID=A0A0P1BA08_9BASI|nr:hypothetical protein CBOM_07464 [Ceraceosorus bombacis]